LIDATTCSLEHAKPLRCTPAGRFWGFIASPSHLYCPKHSSFPTDFIELA